MFIQNKSYDVSSYYGFMVYLTRLRFFRLDENIDGRLTVDRRGVSCYAKLRKYDGYFGRWNIIKHKDGNSWLRWNPEVKHHVKPAVVPTRTI